MNRLREFLRDRDPMLIQALEASWKIAEAEWTPTLRMDGESHGGLPHLHSVEDWMDKIAQSCRSIWSSHSDTPFGFNALELYLALCAALFHDIGRGRTDRHHGKVSADILKASWAQLGIISGRVADELGHICEFHTAQGPWPHNDAIKIHPWGTVHTQAIAALLVLADELDTAYTRAAPQYMKDPNSVLDERKTISLEQVERHFTKGFYRDFISDVDLDPDSHLLKTVLFNDRLIGHADRNAAHDSNAGRWLAGIRDTKTVPESFRPEDYFFSFLEHSRSRLDADFLEVLAQQYDNADNFERNRRIRQLRAPARSVNLDALEYNLRLGDRQFGTKPTTATARDARSIDDLDNTIALIKDTVEAVEGKRREGNVALARAAVGPVLYLLEAASWFQYYLSQRAFIISRERREGKDWADGCISRLDDRWRQVRKAVWEAPHDGDYGQLDTTEDEPREADAQDQDALRALRERRDQLKNVRQVITITFSPDGSAVATVSTAVAHRLLVLLLQHLPFVDLTSDEGHLWYGADGWVPNSGVEFRVWEGWSVDAFHENLLAVFQVYLVNARKLLYEEGNLDYRYEAGERSRGTATTRLSAIQRFATLLTGVRSERDGDSPDSSTLDSLRRVVTGLERHVTRCRARGGQHKIDACDFHLAARLIFMQWLTNDLKKKNTTLTRIRAGLEKLEVPFTVWLIEYNNHLFDPQWNLSLEPSLKKAAISDIATQVFALQRVLHVDEDHIRWNTLAAAVRDPKGERVRTGAARVATVLQMFSYLPKDPATPADLKDRRQLLKRTKEGRPACLHYGHELLSALYRAQLERGSPGRDIRNHEWKLETSHSSWKLTQVGSGRTGTATSRSDDYLTMLLEYLDRLAEYAGES